MERPGFPQKTGPWKFDKLTKGLGMFGLMNTLSIVICEDANDAVANGHVYHNGEVAVEIEKVVVVRHGTDAGNSTVDLVMVDQSGKRYVVMLTGALLRSIPTFGCDHVAPDEISVQ